MTGSAAPSPRAHLPEEGGRASAAQAAARGAEHGGGDASPAVELGRVEGPDDQVLDVEGIVEEIRRRAAALQPIQPVTPGPEVHEIEVLAGSTDTYSVPLTFARGALNPLVRAVASAIRRLLTPVLMAQVHQNERTVHALRALAGGVEQLRLRVEELEQAEARDGTRSQERVDELERRVRALRAEVERLRGRGERGPAVEA